MTLAKMVGHALSESMKSSADRARMFVNVPLAIVGASVKLVCDHPYVCLSFYIKTKYMLV